MNMELTKEAAEKIGEYTKYGKEKYLAKIIERGGAAYKEIKADGRKEGFELIMYYSSTGELVAVYDPIRATISEMAKEKRSIIH